MKQKLMKSFAVCVLATAALWAGGCAKQQVVKPDPVIPNAASKAAVSPATTKPTAEMTPQIKEAALAAANIDESAMNKESHTTASQTAPDASLKAALEKVYFDFDSFTLSDKARQALAKNVEVLQKNSEAKIRIEGHCDELGSDDYNLALGERRANAALKYMQTLGVAAERLSTISYGKERPIDPGHVEASRAKNRRDEFVVTTK